MRTDGDLIRAWRKRLGLSQEKMAKVVGVTVSTMNRWEQGAMRPGRLAWLRLEQVAKDMGIPLEREKEEGG